jgi:hypothetical protein
MASDENSFLGLKVLPEGTDRRELSALQHGRVHAFT